LESFLPGYRDPIFSIILILLIALAIAIASYGWSIYKEERLKRSLFGFLDRFESDSCSLEEENIPFDKSMIKPLIMLARAYEKSGEYNKTISICLYLIRHTKDDELLIYLANAYMKAGFLQRSKEILEEVISRHPRRVDVLYSLEILYEKMGDFESAKEALDALKAQDEDIEGIYRYIEVKEIISDKTISPTKKIELLKQRVFSQDITIYRMVIKELFILDTKIAWESIDRDRIIPIIDILWFLPYSQLSLDIINTSKLLQAIYYARGDIDNYDSECGVFAIDILCSARKSGYSRGDLEFSYLCKSCKHSFPISFNRCPNCMAVNSIDIEESLAKRRDERGETLL